jgi:hypothetical protein
MLAEEFGIITDQEVGEAVDSAEMLEEYPGDRPYPSCLLFGLTRLGRPLHLVAAYDEAGPRVIVVTVYHPDPREWEDSRRRKR